MYFAKTGFSINGKSKKIGELFPKNFLDTKEINYLLKRKLIGIIPPPKKEKLIESEEEAVQNFGE